MAVLLKKVIYVIKWEWKERRLREKKGTQMLANLLSKKENMINDQITSIWKSRTQADGVSEQWFCQSAHGDFDCGSRKKLNVVIPYVCVIFPIWMQTA